MKAIGQPTSVTLKLNITASFLLLNAGSGEVRPLCRSATKLLLRLSSSRRTQAFMLNFAVDDTKSRLSPSDAFLQAKRTYNVSGARRGSQANQQGTLPCAINARNSTLLVLFLRTSLVLFINLLSCCYIVAAG
jgi:hypothetical protein